ncbi:hypothetical protein O6H91_08G069300 [Diphasiastrum complanatum]|uniref:Uncharacterized protein n=1 Tax=Diphasiastrum complanatum TaxID=34168 RepID=A0ACC2CYR8_DIPCM|nr:hypothetical protein O6H91_08G069300 [Diphasiastrum complanatum]
MYVHKLKTPMATLQFSHDNAVDTVLVIFKLKPDHTFDEMLQIILADYEAFEKADEFYIAATLRSLDNAYGACYGHYKKGIHITTAREQPHFSPTLKALQTLSDIEILEVEVIPGLSKTDEAAKLSKGDILHMGLLSTEPESQQDVIETLQKALKESRDSLTSVTLHKSRDGNKVVVIGVWTDVASAQAATSTGSQQAEEVIGHVVKSKELIVFEVVLVR